jgi:protein-tyrosine phosphatase
MAEALFRRALASRGVGGMAISMGTLNLTGRAAAPHAIEALDEIGVDLRGHRSQGLSLGLLRAADAVFAMESMHVAELGRLAPDLAGRVDLLGRWAPDPEAGGEEIPDPIRDPIETYRAVRDRMVAAIDHFLDAKAPRR